MQVDGATLARLEIEFEKRTEIPAVAAARIIGVNEKTLRQWAAHGGIGSRPTPSGRRVFTRWHILEYCERDQCPSKSEKRKAANGDSASTSKNTANATQGHGSAKAPPPPKVSETSARPWKADPFKKKPRASVTP